MADQQFKAPGAQPHTTSNERGHPLPRRASPEQSVTLRHHRLARDATMKALGRSANLGGDPSISPCRHSSGESQETRNSDPKNWFDQSNRNPTATYDDSVNMDVDPPFFQHETDSSNEIDGLPTHAFGPGGRVPPRLRPAVTQSSSADDYRSVIDDLTIENKRLKEELKRYKQFGPDMMKKEKLFEIKVHGLPGRKKRELEATLRDFAAGLEGSSEATSQRRKPGRHLKDFYSGESRSKHASSSSSNSRPVDSAYASMSTAGQSSAAPQSSVGGPSLHGRPSIGSRAKSSNQRVESYLEDTPGGLMPRHTVLTDKEKKKIVVRRLEQLFTGKITGRIFGRNQSLPSCEAPFLTDTSAILIPSLNPGAAREARIQQFAALGSKSRSRDNVSMSGDQTESGGAHGAGDGGRSGSRSGHNTSPPAAQTPEQRPTRPRDLDPDRVKLPSENMDYIRHLGLVPPEFLHDKKLQRQDVSPDADGWVYLNLLCNLAQLHMVNVTPAFIRSAVLEKSAKFQLSPDGRKIRWRGGTDGTKFSSDSSGENDNSPRSPSNADETDGSNATGSRKKQRTNSGAALTSAASSRDSKLGLVSGSSSGFHYKPIFVRQVSFGEVSTGDSSSQESYAEEGNNSKWDMSGSGAGQRKRRRDGAIIYYSGAPFCTDLSGDPGDLSPTTYMTSAGQSRDLDLRAFQPVLTRTLSGSSLVIRPLSDDRAIVAEAMDMDLDNPPDLVTDDGDSANYSEFEFPWCEEPDKTSPLSLPLGPRLEPSGLGGVVPEDHFAVFCQTRHPVLKNKQSVGSLRSRSEDIAEAIASRLAGLSTSSPAPLRDHKESSVEMTYISGRMIRMNPVPLPPPAMFIPPFSSSSEADTYYDEELDSGDEEDEDVDYSSEEIMSQLANPHQSDNKSDNTYPEDQDLSSNDEEDEAGDGEDVNMALNVPGAAKRASGGKTPDTRNTGSSVATAGGGDESGYSSSVEDNSK